MLPPSMTYFFSAVCFIKLIVKRVWTEGEVKLGIPFITFSLWKSAFFVSSGCIYNRFIMSCHEQVCLIMFNERYYFERYFFHHWAIVSTQQNFQKGVAWQGLNFQMGVVGKKGGWLFQGRLQFSHKNKLKSEIFNDEKNYKQQQQKKLGNFI